MPDEGPETPKLCLGISPRSLDAAAMRRVKQIGVNHVLMGGPRIPWQEAEVRARMERLRQGGLTLGNMMIGGFRNTIYGRPGRDEEIDKVRQSIRAAGRAGLPVGPAGRGCRSSSTTSTPTGPWKATTRKPGAAERG